MMVYLFYGFYIYVLIELYFVLSMVRYVVMRLQDIGMVLSILVCDCVNYINGNWESVEYVLNNFDSNVG